jgi:ferredoxin-NADP reductase
MKTPAVLLTAEKIRTCLIAKDRLNDTIIRLRLGIPETGYDYYAGQCLTLYNNQGVGRTYCLSSVPGLDDFLELQICLTPHGALTSWIYGELKAGDQVRISPASGDCFYLPGNNRQPIMLIGTGIALAALYGILRDALVKNRHRHQRQCGGAGPDSAQIPAARGQPADSGLGENRVHHYPHGHGQGCGRG